MSFYDDASWLLIPSGIKEDIVFAQKPTSGLGDLTFTRASDATYTDAGGVVRRSPYNLLQQSETFDNAIWGTVGATKSANVAVSPDGTTNADEIIGNGTNASIRVFQGVTTTAGENTFSCFLKAGTVNFGFLQYSAFVGSSGAIFAYFDLVNGTTPTPGAKIENYGNGWYRCSAVATIASGYVAGDMIIRAVPSTSSSSFPSAADAIGKSILVWGAQLVAGTEALDYFPTTNRQDVPRIDFRNADGTLSSCGRLLLEPQRTNLVTYSQDLNLWSGSNVTITSNTSQSPDGLQNADNVNITATNGFWRRNNLTLANSTSYAASVFVKKSATTGTKTFRFYYNNNTGAPSNGVWNCVVDLTNITATTTTSGTAVTGAPTILNTNLLDYGNDWYRVVVAFTTGSSAGNSGSEIGFQANGVVVDFDAFGAQLELGAYGTTYIPTTTAAVTRLADSASKTGVSSLIGQTEGTLFVEVPLEYLNPAQYRNLISVTDGTYNNAAVIVVNNAGGNSNQFNFGIRNAGSSVAAINAPNLSIANIGSTYKIAAAYKDNDFVFYINGVQIGADTSGSISGTLSRIDIGSIGFTGLSTTDRQSVNQAALFPTRLTNEQLVQLTTL